MYTTLKPTSTYSGTLEVVTGKNSPQIVILDDLRGKEIYVNPVSLSYKLLQEQGQKLKQAGKPEIIVKESDPNLTDEDLLEMTNAGIVPATAVFDYRAELWSVVLPDIIIHRDIALTNEANLAWAMRKNSPQLKAVMDDFILLMFWVEQAEGSIRSSLQLASASVMSVERFVRARAILSAADAILSGLLNQLRQT